MKTIIRLASIAILLITGIGNVWGDTHTWTLSNGILGDGSTPATSVVVDSKTWNIDWTWYNSSYKYIGWGDTKGVQIGKGTEDYGGTTVKLSTSGISGRITQVTVNASIPNSGDANVYVKVGSTSFMCSGRMKVDLTTTATAYDFTGVSSGTIEVTLDNNATAKGMYLKSIVVTYSTSTYAITFNAGTGSCDVTTTSAVSNYTLPDATPSSTCIAEGWAFYGWSTTNCSSETSTIPAIVGKKGDTFYPTAVTTLYAVYAKGEYTKVNSLTSGSKYLIVAQSSGGDNYIMKSASTMIDGYSAVVGAQINETFLNTYSAGAIHQNWVYTIAGTSGSYTIRDGFNDSESNYMDMSWGSYGWFGYTSTADSYTITGSDGVWTIKSNYSESDYYLGLDEDEEAFFLYDSDQEIFLYKETKTPSYWASPSCCNKIVTLNSGTETHATIDDMSAFSLATCSSTDEDRQVTIIASPASGYDFNSTTRLTFTKSSGTFAANSPSYISGPTDNGDGSYSFVYQFANDDNGVGVFNVTGGQFTNYRIACYREFDDGEGDGLWSTAGNWTNDRLPTIRERADILKPVTVDITDATAKSVVLKQNSGNNGHLEIPAGKELVVATTVRKTTDGSTLVATGVNDIEISSTSTLGLGALVMGTHDGTNKATVNFYTRSNGKKETNTSVGQYVGTPFNDETNILYNWYNSWIYRIVYNSGVIGWDRVNEGEGMDPFKGYCVFSADAWDNDAGHSYWMQGTLVTSANQTCSGLNWQSGSGTANLNNENLLANSWMAPIKIKAMQTSDFHNADATIYIFNSTSSSAYEDLAGNYDTYTVGTSEAVIPAMQSFSVFTTGSGASVTLDYNRIVYAPAVAGTATPTANKAPRRAGASEAEADKMRLFVRTEDGYGDMLYMWEREDFAEGFENGWDGRKLYGESYAPQLYAITPDGEMAVNCVPDWEGTVVGFRAGTEDNMYTFSFEYDGSQTWYLNDLKAEQSTRILSGNTYAFSTASGDLEARFIISATPINYVATGVENGAAETNAVRKLLINDHVYIIRNGRMYDATGVMVK